MQIFSARVQDGVIVPEDGVTLPEGSKVTTGSVSPAGYDVVCLPS